MSGYLPSKVRVFRRLYFSRSSSRASSVELFSLPLWVLLTQRGGSVWCLGWAGQPSLRHPLVSSRSLCPGTLVSDGSAPALAAVCGRMLWQTPPPGFPGRAGGVPMAGSLLLLGLPWHAAPPGHCLGSATWLAASIYWLLAISRQHKGFSLFSKSIQLVIWMHVCGRNALQMF